MKPRHPPSRSADQREVVFWRDPALPMIEGRQSTVSDACYRPHTHSTLSIGIIDGGASTFRLGRRTFRMRAGQVVIIAPDQVHVCHPLPGQPWRYRMFYFEAAWARTFLPKFAAHTPWPQGVVTHPAASALIDRIEHALNARRQRPGDRLAAIGECVRQLLQRCETGKKPAAVAAPVAVTTARNYLDAHFLEPVPVAQLARLARMSPFQLIRRFKREFGLTPHAYQLDRRINHTRGLLQQGHALADVAYAAGFADQSHFQRVFKPHVAATPAEYRRTSTGRVFQSGLSGKTNSRGETRLVGDDSPYLSLG